MAQRVGPHRRVLRLLGGATGRLLGPWLRARSRAAILPDRGTFPLTGLGAGARAGFDAHGVPHVRAQSDEDLFRAQGWCHARDRFFQMDMLRRVLAGRLAETVGERRLGTLALPPFQGESTTLGADRLLVVLGLREAAERAWAESGAESRAALEAYAQGVNAALEPMSRRVPLEHRLLRLALEPWRPQDSILVAKGMALGLSFKWRTAPVFTALAERLAQRPEHLGAILPAVPGEEEAPEVAHCVAQGMGAALSFLPFTSNLRGSNAWIVGGRRTASGAPLLASDPHLEMALPSIWYLASLWGERYRAVGATLPGLPGVVIGRTPEVAWGLTNAMVDDGDLWLERLDVGGERYEVDGEWRSLEVRTREVLRRGRPSVGVRVRGTHRGPLLSDAFPDDTGPALSIRLALHEAGDDLASILALGRARDVAQALEAAEGYGAPAQNLLVADCAGRAAYRLMGRVPARERQAHPALARDGTRSSSDWTGWVPAASLPHAEVGAREHLVSANHAHVAGGRGPYLSHLYEPGYRARRIAEAIEGRHDLTAGDALALQQDARNLAVPRLRAALLDEHTPALVARRPEWKVLVDVVQAWDGSETVSSRGAVAWHLLYHHLLRRVFEPALGPALMRHWSALINLVDGAFFRALERADGPWLPPERRSELLGQALEDVRRDLQQRRLAPDAPWGALHVLRLRHPAGAAGPLSRAFDRGPYPAPGGPFSVCSGQYLHPRPGPMVVGPSYRQVVDLGEPDAARMITFGGQSGHVGSPHYDDFTPLWLAGGTLPMRWAHDDRDPAVTFVPA